MNASLFARLGLLLCLSASSVAADTLYFIASLDSNQMINYSWFSGNNWYMPDPENPGKYVHVGTLPQPTDTAIVLTDVNAAGNNINLAAVLFSGLPMEVMGGNFIVGTFASDPGWVFAGSSIEVSLQMTTSGLELNGAQVTIQSGASWLMESNAYSTVLSDTTILNVGQVVIADKGGFDETGGGSGVNTFINRSTVSSSGLGTINGPMVFDQGGLVRGDVGTLTFGSVTWTNGTTNLSKFRTSATNATIVIDNLASIPSNSVFAFSGPGLSIIKDDVAVVEGTLQVGVVDPTTGIIDVGTVTCSADLAGSGMAHVVASNGYPSTLNWMAPSTISLPLVNIDAGGVLNIIGTDENNALSNCVVNNSGTANWTGGVALNIGNNSVFNNLAGALFDAKTNENFFGGGGTNLFNNAGVLRKSGGTGDVPFQQSGGPLFFNNMGLLDVQTGRVLLEGGTNMGQLNVGAGAQLRFEDGFFLLAPGSSFSGAGTVGLGGSEPTLMLDANVATGIFTMDEGGGILDGAGSLTVNGAFNWSGGTIQGSGGRNIAAGASLTVSGGTFHGVVNNSGMAAFSAILPMGEGAVFNNLSGAVCAMQAGSGLSYDTGAWPILNNSGTLSNAIGSYVMVDAALNNSGTVIIQSNRLTFDHGYVQTTGTTTVAPGATLELASAGALLSGGTLNGEGIVDGALTNSATVKPGSSPGVLNFTYYNKAYTQTGAGALNVEIGGLAPGSEYDQLSVQNGGTATLDGALNLTIIDGFTPALGDTFSIINCATETGKFARITGNHLGKGLVLVPQYSTTNVALVVANELNLMAPARNANGFSFAFSSTAGISNVVEFADSLTEPVAWQILTNLAGTGALIQILDPAGNGPARFYRARFQ